MNWQNCHLLVQSNLNAIESQKIARAAEGLGLGCTLFKVRPFSNKMPRLGAAPPFILIGSTTLNRLAAQSTKYRSGVFFNEKFTPQWYAQGYGPYFLNFDHWLFRVQDLPEDLFDPHGEVFVRSNDDSKQISGGVAKYAELLKIKANTESHWVEGDLFTPQSLVFISSVKEVLAEYRFIICQKNIVGYSRYRPSVHYSVPQDVVQFAQDMTNMWEPHEVYVLDVCETNDGLRVVECNCVNGSGWYDANYGNVLYHLANYSVQQLAR